MPKSGFASTAITRSLRWLGQQVPDHERARRLAHTALGAQQRDGVRTGHAGRRPDPPFDVGLVTLGLLDQQAGPGHDAGAVDAADSLLNKIIGAREADPEIGKTHALWSAPKPIGANSEPSTQCTHTCCSAFCRSAACACTLRIVKFGFCVTELVPSRNAGHAPAPRASTRDAVTLACKASYAERQRVLAKMREQLARALARTGRSTYWAMLSLDKDSIAQYVLLPRRAGARASCSRSAASTLCRSA